MLLAVAAPCPGMAAQGDPSVQSLVRFFESKTRSLPAAPLDFHITGAFAVIETGSRDSSGRYGVTAYNITRLAPDIYRLDLSLEKQLARDVPTFEQPYFFTEQRSYYFWYQNGERIVFKVGSKKVVLRLGRKDVMRVDIHSPDTYSLNRQTMMQDMEFTDGPVTVHLQIRFN